MIWKDRSPTTKGIITGVLIGLILGIIISVIVYIDFSGDERIASNILLLPFIIVPLAISIIINPPVASNPGPEFAITLLIILILIFYVVLGIIIGAITGAIKLRSRKTKNI